MKASTFSKMMKFHGNKKFTFSLPNGKFLRIIKTKKIGVGKEMVNKLAIIMFVIMLALFALIIRVFLIQNSNAKTYNEKILRKQNYDSTTIPFKRGDILDRNGTYIAKSEKLYRLILDPKHMIQPEIGEKSEAERAAITASVEQTAALLEELFGYSAEEITQLFWTESHDAYIIYANNLTHEQKGQFEERKLEINTQNINSNTAGRISGVWFEDQYVRNYPYAEIGCDIIGFASSDSTEGTGGIEQFYNEELIGTSGRAYGYLNDINTLERNIKPATDGSNIMSTMDINIQNIVERHIKQREAEVGSKRTAVIIMNPNTGEILALATSKGYDLNHPRDLSRYYLEEEITAMNESQQLEALSGIWRNFAVSDTFEPGSPAKVFTTSAAFEENVISSGDRYICNGVQVVQDAEIKCAVRTGHGEIDNAGSLIHSCNMVMMDMAFKLGVERFCKHQRIFGFGSKTGIDLPGEADTSGLIHTVDNMMPVDLATNSFGQNYNCTMIQMAAAFCSAINGGSYYEPHVVKRIVDSNGSLKKDVQPTIVRETVSQETSAFLRDALHRVVTEGTGMAANIPGYEVGGKTGTAEKYPRGMGNYLLSFAGFVPASNPEVFCYVIIDEPRVEDQAHSTYASSLFASIMAEVLPAMNIFPNTQNSEQSSTDAGLPSEEGITSTTPESVAPEVVQPSEEYIPRDDSSIPAGNIPAQETTQDSGLNLDTNHLEMESVYQTQPVDTTRESISEMPDETIHSNSITAPTAESIEETVAPH